MQQKQQLNSQIKTLLGFVFDTSNSVPFRKKEKLEIRPMTIMGYIKISLLQCNYILILINKMYVIGFRLRLVACNYA